MGAQQGRDDQGLPVRDVRRPEDDASRPHRQEGTPVPSLQHHRQPRRADLRQQGTAQLANG